MCCEFFVLILAQGYAFCEFRDVSVTDAVIQALNVKRPVVVPQQARRRRQDSHIPHWRPLEDREAVLEVGGEAGVIDLHRRQFHFCVPHIQFEDTYAGRDRKQVQRNVYGDPLHRVRIGSI